MTIKIFNTINRKKEIFKPVKSGSVSMYVCGPTVYSHPHIGNARAALVPDILFRLLKRKYDNVTYIRNITDVDDKISDAAFKQKKTVYEISETFIKIYQDNMASLDILEPTYQPRVTDNMPGIISTIEKILKNYKVKNYYNLKEMLNNQKITYEIKFIRLMFFKSNIIIIGKKI